MSHWTDRITGRAQHRPCPCGGCDYREEISDARGIFVAYVCEDCRRGKLEGYRPEIFTE